MLRSSIVKSSEISSFRSSSSLRSAPRRAFGRRRGRRDLRQADPPSPHVFAAEEVQGTASVAKRWDEIKAMEGKGDILDVPKALPALTRR